MIKEAKDMENKRRLTLVMDVDGVMTTGRFFYTASDGKYIKEFGSDDNDGLSLLRPYFDILFVSGDKRGFNISSKRIQEDMGYKIFLVSTTKRAEWIRNKFKNSSDVIYLGDGIFDHYVFREVGYSIATANALPHVQARANYVTSRKGAEGAVAEAALHLLEKFFKPYNPDKPLSANIKYSGTWHI